MSDSNTSQLPPDSEKPILENTLSLDLKQLDNPNFHELLNNDTITSTTQSHKPFENSNKETIDTVISDEISESMTPAKYALLAAEDEEDVDYPKGPPAYDPTAFANDSFKYDDIPECELDDEDVVDDNDVDSASIVNRGRKGSIVIANPNDADLKSTTETKFKYGKEENNVLILLFLVGMIVGGLNGLTIWLIGMLIWMQAIIINLNNSAGPMFYMFTTAYLVGFSAFICKIGKRPAAMGSGIPEVKAMLATDFHPTEYNSVVSLRIHAIRIIGLIFACGSSLSIGNAAPMIHGAVCTAYNLMKFIPEFGDLRDNPSMSKQVFAAAAAAGLVTVFNAPVGGLLFCVEITTSYYFLSNYWKAFFAATTGAVSYTIVINLRNGNYRDILLPHISIPFQKWEFPFFILLSFITGWIALIYLRVQQRWFVFAKPYMVKYPELCAAGAGFFTALMIYATGAYGPLSMSIGFITKDAFQTGYVVQMGKYDANPYGGLFCSIIVRFILVIIGVSQRIPAGLFGAMLCLGALLGRFFGLVMSAMFGDVIYVGGYAIVGAVAFISGTTHTISGAVILIELTGQLEMLLPCLIAAVVASGICKSRSLSLYDQGMVNKALESFQLLLTETGGYSFAHEIYNPSVCYITSLCKVEDLLLILDNEKQTIFPVVDNKESLTLVGSIARIDIFRYLKKVFEDHRVGAYIDNKLSGDLKIDNDLIRREQKKEERKKWLNKIEKGKKWINKISNTKKNEEDKLNESLKKIYQVPDHTNNNTSSSNTTGINSNNNSRKSLNILPSSIINHNEDDDINNNDNKDITNNNNIPTEISENNAIDEQQYLVRKEMMRLFSMVSHNYDSEYTLDIGYNEEVVAEVLKLEIDVLYEKLLPINGFPFTAHHNTPMEQIYILFEMVNVNCVFIVGEDKQLQGMISKDHLLKELKRKAKKNG